MTGKGGLHRTLTLRDLVFYGIICIQPTAPMPMFGVVSQEARGHVIAKLLVELPDATRVPKDLIEQGRVLDNFYIPSRYPNSHPEGAPFEHYGPLQSEEAIRHARTVADFVRSQMA